MPSLGSNLVKEELRLRLIAEVTLWNSAPFQYGLFTNDLDDTVRDHVIGDITPCSGAGYSGLQNFGVAGSPTWDGTWWSAVFPTFTWTFDGSATRTIRGTYVVDDSGVLRAWKKYAGAGITVGFFAGQTFSSTVTRSKSSYP